MRYTDLSELMLHQIWLWQWRLPEILHSVDGRAVRVIQPGWWRYGVGPDIQRAIFIIDNTRICGDIELHLRTDGWWTHGHHRDPRYARVVLHVVLESSRRPVFHLAHSAAIPEVALAAYLSENDLAAFPRQSFPDRRPLAPMCGTHLAGQTESERIWCVRALGIAYLHRRAMQYHRTLHRGVAPVACLYSGLMRGLGSGATRIWMETLARMWPWEALRMRVHTEGRFHTLRALWASFCELAGPRWGPYRPAQHPLRRLAWIVLLADRTDEDPLRSLLTWVHTLGSVPVSAMPQVARDWHRLTRTMTALRWSGPQIRVGDGSPLSRTHRLVGHHRWTTLWWNVVVPVSVAIRYADPNEMVIPEPVLRMPTGPMEIDWIQRAMRRRWGAMMPPTAYRDPLVQLGIHELFRYVCNTPTRSCFRCPLAVGAASGK